MTSQDASFASLTEKANDRLRFFICVLALMIGKGNGMSSGTTTKIQPKNMVLLSSVGKSSTRMKPH